MGCGISKLDIAAMGEALPCSQSSTPHRRNDGAVVDSGGEEHAKGDDIHHIKKVNSEEKGETQRAEKEEACDMEDNEEDGDDIDYSISNVRSPSFRVYCFPSQFDDENSEGETNPGKIKDKQQGDVQHEKKGSITRCGKKGRVGKGLKTGSGKVKSFLRLIFLQSIHQSS